MNMRLKMKRSARQILVPRRKAPTEIRVSGTFTHFTHICQQRQAGDGEVLGRDFWTTDVTSLKY